MISRSNNSKRNNILKESDKFRFSQIKENGGSGNFLKEQVYRCKGQTGIEMTCKEQVIGMDNNGTLTFYTTNDIKDTNSSNFDETLSMFDLPLMCNGMTSLCMLEEYQKEFPDLAKDIKIPEKLEN